MTLRKVEKGAEPLRGLIALAGPSNSGKTFSALRIATGIVESLGNGKGIALLDTELRGNLYHGMFDYERFVMEPPFSPKAFLDAYRELDGRYSVIISDNFSDEHEGPGGILEMAMQSPLQNDVAKWAKPKAEHKQLMAAIRLLKSQHIFCLRASDKIKIVDGEDKHGNKKKIVEAVGWQPTCEKNFLYDVTLGWMLPPNSKGHANVWKSIEGFDFKDGQQLTEDHGRAIARWIKGEEAVPKSWREGPNGELPPSVLAATRMPESVRIVDQEFAEVAYTSDPDEALRAYGAAKKASANPGSVTIANRSALQTILDYPTLIGRKTHDALKAELEGIAA
jgi:hypothetical protein